MATQQTTTTSFPFLSLLALLFIGLKLGGVITWSWWWVTAPLWGGAVFLILVFIAALIVLARQV